MNKRELNENLVKMAKNGVLINVKELIKSGANPGYKKNSVLMLSIKNHQWHVVDFLLTQKIDINMNEGEALRYAVERSNLSLVKKIVESGANLYLYINDPFSENPFEYCSSKQNPELFEILQYLIEAEKKKKPLKTKGLQSAMSTASTYRNLPVIKYCIEKGIKNAKDEMLKVYLIEAIEDGNKLSELENGLKNKLNLHLDSEWLLSYAVQKKHIEAINLLLKYGANPHVKNKEIFKKSIIHKTSEVFNLLSKEGKANHYQNFKSLYKNLLSKTNPYTLSVKEEFLKIAAKSESIENIEHISNLTNKKELKIIRKNGSDIVNDWLTARLFSDKLQNILETNDSIIKPKKIKI